MFLLMVLLLLPAPFSAAEADMAPERTLLVHVRTLLDGGTDQTVLVPQVIAGALKMGCKVVLLFDGEGALSLKIGRWFGGPSTPLDRVDITRKEQQHLADLLGTKPDSFPDNYGSLLHFYKGRGVAVSVNQQALQLHGTDEDHVDHAAEAVGEDRILGLLASAGMYVSY